MAASKELPLLINALKSTRNEASLHKAAKDLRNYVEAESRELSDEKLASFQEEIMLRIHELFHADSKLAGIVGVSHLVDLEYIDNTKMVTRLSNYIHNCLPCDSHQQTRLAARLMGRLAVAGGTITHDFAEAEMRRSLEWLSLAKDNDNKRFASVLMLKELAENAPQLVYQRVESILNNIWNALRDMGQHVREAAASALGSVLDLIGTREYEHRSRWYKSFYQSAMRGLEQRGHESILHASLLALAELVSHHGRRAKQIKEVRADGNRPGSVQAQAPAEEKQEDFGFEHFQAVGQKVLGLKDHKVPLIRMNVMSMLPTLARFQPDTFTTLYLAESIVHLLNTINTLTTTSIERATALSALGGLAEVTGKSFAQIQRNTSNASQPKEKLCGLVVGTLKSFLAPRKGKGGVTRDDRQTQAEVLSCFAKIVKACADDESMGTYVNELLPSICSLGLSAELGKALVDITNTLPYTLKRVQKALLEQISRTLGPVTRPVSETKGGSSKGDRRSKANALEAEATDGDDKLVALQTLCNFNFRGSFHLVAFVKDTVVDYLKDPLPKLRNAAAKACCAVVAQALDAPKIQGKSEKAFPAKTQDRHLKTQDRQFMPHLLCSLLAVAVSDADAGIRLVVLNSLETRFDPYLASPECLRLLFMCLNDESFPNRHAAIDIIGRLNRRNPSYIQTSFRGVLLQLINELEYTMDARKEKESALMLGKVIRAAPALMPPYAPRLLQVLVNKLQEVSVPAVTGTLLSTIGGLLLSTLGGLSVVCGQQMKDTPRLLPLVIEILMDQVSWVKRIHALRALGNIVVSTGNVITPYVNYPQLLPFLLKALQVDQEVDWDSRREIMKLLGTIGAIDPYRHKQVQLRFHEDSEQKSRDSQKSRPFGLKGEIIPFSRLTPHMEEFYPKVVINCLLSFLNDDTLAEHHQFAMAGFLPIFRSLGIPKCLHYLPHVLPRLLKLAETDNLIPRDHTLGQVNGLLNYVKQHAIEFMPELIQLIKNFSNSTEEGTLTQILALVEEMRVAFHEDFPLCLPWLIPWLVKLVTEDFTDTRKISVKVFHCFEILGDLCAHYLNFVIPCLVDCMADAQATDTVAAYQCRTAACNTLSNMCRQLNLSAYSARIIHPLCRTLVETFSATPTSHPSLMTAGSSTNVLSGVPQPLKMSTSEDGQQAPMSPPINPPLALAMAGLHEGATALLCYLVHNMGTNGLRYALNFQVIVKTHRLSNPIIDALLQKMQAGEVPDPASLLDLAHPHSPMLNKQPSLVASAFGPNAIEESHDGPNPMNATNLTSIYEISRVTEEDWVSWLNRFSLELIRQSPSTAIRHCFQLGVLYLPLARELFNAAFVSCYNNLKDADQSQLLASIAQALISKTAPVSVRQTLLNFAEFLEHEVTLTGNGAAIFVKKQQAQMYAEIENDSISRLLRRLKGLPLYPHLMGGDTPPPQLVGGNPNMPTLMADEIFDTGILARNAVDCHLYAKALRYKELQFMKLVEGYRRVHNNSLAVEKIDVNLVKETERPKIWLRICQELVDVNHKLDLPESALGIIRFCQNNLYRLGITSIDEFLSGAGDVLEKLNRWDESLKVYERRLVEDKGSLDHLLGVMRSLRAMGEWGQLFQVCEERWRSADDYTRHHLAGMGAHSAWMLSKWNFLAKATEYIDKNSSTAFFFQSILSVHAGEYEKATERIEQCRKSLAPVVGTYISESYDRAYHSVVQLQMLNELEEVIEIKKHQDPDKKAQFRSVWGGRLKGMQLHVQYWEEVLAVQTLALTPHENLHSWLKFSNLCRQAGKPKLAQTTLINLLTPELIQQYDQGSFKPSTLLTAPNALPQVVCAYFGHMWGVGEKTEAFNLMSEYVQKLHASSIPTQECPLAQGYLTLGEWQQQLQKDCYNNEQKRKVILHHLQMATQLDPQTQKAWHAWALFNQKIAERLQKKKVPRDVVLPFLVCAIRGFVQSISLCSSDISMSVQDILRLLTIWFNNGGVDEVYAEVTVGMTKISTEAWLLVIPQIIARMQVNACVAHSVSEGVCILLSRIGQVHPQALIYPLTVAAKDTGAGIPILEAMKAHSPSLVSQAEIVSDELIRVAILWSEQWYEGIEQASKAYYNGNADAMMAVFTPLHNAMQNADTEVEKEFVSQFGSDLQEAHNWCKQYKQTRKQTDINKAWDLYYHVFRRLGKFQNLNTLELSAVAPKLAECRNLDLAVPGQYRAGENPPCIGSFAPTLKVIQSKQRPRKLTMFASDGNEYAFLLKGHEDLRQDQRVMQLFGLVNNFFLYDLETARRDLSIEKYPVIPLSSNVGIIGWLEHAETFHNLVVEYRKSKKMHLNYDYRLMLQMTGDYDNLTLMQKVEVFEYALENTDGQDLNKVLWLRSPSSQVWLDRRTCYTRSLATMSMVGYILGLGDRHPGNIMLDKVTNKIIHIDFGDCFEVAQQREKFPEKVPFRLTRMLVNAMEASGIDGTFRTTCERVMKVLRKNKDSLMAMLEAFVHDPLIAWRLAGAVGNMRENTIANTTTATPKTQHLMNDPVNSFPDNTDNASMSLYSRTARERLLYSASLSASAEHTNKKALEVVTRIKRKLEGTEFAPHLSLASKNRHQGKHGHKAHTEVPDSGVVPEAQAQAQEDNCHFPTAPSQGKGTRAATAEVAEQPAEEGEAPPNNGSMVGSTASSCSSSSSTSEESSSPEPDAGFQNSDSTSSFPSSAASTTTLECTPPSHHNYSFGGSSDGSQDSLDSAEDEDSKENTSGDENGESENAAGEEAQPPQQEEGASAPAKSQPRDLPGSTVQDKDKVPSGGDEEENTQPQADKSTEGGLPVEEQVQRLIRQAMSHQNLCQCYIGWCPFW